MFFHNEAPAPLSSEILIESRTPDCLSAFIKFSLFIRCFVCNHQRQRVTIRYGFTWNGRHTDQSFICLRFARSVFSLRQKLYHRMTLTQKSILITIGVFGKRPVTSSHVSEVSSESATEQYSLKKHEEAKLTGVLKRQARGKPTDNG